MPLDFAAAVRQQRARILQRWQHRVAALTESMSISRIELLDHIPDFVDGLIAMLDEPERDGTTSGDEAAQRYAPAHGEQRLHVGFDVDEVVREYGILTDVIIEVLLEVMPEVDVRQLGRLLVAVNAGAAEAVSAYARHRDAELAREQGRHRAFIAHELRTPLMNALVAASLLERRDPAIGAAAPTPILRRSLEQLRQLIDQVLVVGRLGAGIEPVRAEVDVVALVREIAETLQPEAETRDVAMNLDVPPDTVLVQADARLLTSAIANLLRNAVKYTRPGTPIRVSVKETADDAVVELADRCGGIVATNWADLFDPFERGDDAVTARQPDGLGLGLAIAKQAVEAHGGTLSVENRPPDGCTFALTVPRAPRT